MALKQNVYVLTNLGVVKVAGEKAQGFLQGQLTCDVAQVSEQYGCVGALCNPQGRVLAILFLFKLGQDYLCVLPNAIIPASIQYLQKYAIFSQVTMSDVSHAYFLYGGLGDITLGTMFCRLPGVMPRSIWLSSHQLAPNLLSPDIEEWRLANIRSGLATIYPETIGAVTPHMLNLPKLGVVSFNKGCYVGQEVIARTQYRGKTKRHLCLAEIAEQLPLSSDDIIYANGQEAGLVIDAAPSERGTTFLAVLQEPFDRDFITKGLIISATLL
jgi:tRNA-modifying protein YgfZ